MAKKLSEGRKPGSGRKPGKAKTLAEGRKVGSGRKKGSVSKKLSDGRKQGSGRKPKNLQITTEEDHLIEGIISQHNVGVNSTHQQNVTFQPNQSNNELNSLIKATSEDSLAFYTPNMRSTSSSRPSVPQSYNNDSALSMISSPQAHLESSPSSASNLLNLIHVDNKSILVGSQGTEQSGRLN
ncbi:hypothetical protein WICPIJ_008538 [Wickerhamomyces pijperi]|uniref:Uncharacterized protein n=1 Tax=Wickerhamomyces pijperi TaxID=599730 RepID=A0A9P8PY71_WICPI|nr:hypothetical protein WICPIJ_008538 [Wickerhamomyces pijperi]